MQNPYESPQAVSSDSIGDSSVLEPRPTWARFGVLLFLCSLAFVLYIDRVCIGQAADDISLSLNLNKEQMSWVMNAFIIAYCIFEVWTGSMGDRFGSRGVITRIVIWWSVFTALTGLAFGLWSLIVIRFLFGAGEAGAFPNVARVVTRWFPAGERGIARGAISTTSLVGGALAPPIAAYLNRLVGWQNTIMIFGLVGVSAGALGTLICSYVTYLKFFGQQWADRTWLLQLGIMLVFIGVQLLTMGLLAEMLARTYHESQNKPVYVIREIREAQSERPREVVA